MQSHAAIVSLLATCTLLTAGCTLVQTSPRGPAPDARAAESPVATAATESAPVTETVRVGILNIASDAPLFWADERGYLREQRLAMETARFDSAQRMTTPLGADHLDVGAGAPGPGLYNAVQRGIRLRIVADRGRLVPGTRFNCLVVRKDLLDSGAVQTIADLRGRVLAENVPGTVTTYVLEKHLRQHGVDPGELTYPTLAFPDMLSAFANNAVDAAFLVEPFITVGEDRGVVQCWRPTSQLEPNFQIAMILYGPTFAEDRADAARRFTIAFLRGVRDYYRAFFGDRQNRPEFLDLIARTTGSNVALLDRISPTWMDPNGELNVASLRALQRWFFERGDLTEETDLDSVVDTSFVQHAVARLGRYPVP